MDLCLGDRVAVDIGKESREWGYNPAPNGTEGEVIDFGSIHYGRGSGLHTPGKYRNRSWPLVQLDTGEAISISRCHVKLVDDSGRKEEPYDSILASNEERMRDFLEELPDLPFWEGDIVEFDRWKQEYPECAVSGIEYAHVGRFCNDGVTPYPIYNVSPPGGGGHTAARDEDLVLLRRGNMWKHYHEEPLEFANLLEEADFYKSLGQAHEVRNPACELYKWTIEAALRALQSGVGHGIAVNGPRLGMSPSISVYVYDDTGLGERIAHHTLEGFADRIQEMDRQAAVCHE